MDRKEIEEKFAIGRENVQAIAKQAGELVAAAYEEGFKTCWRIFMGEEFNKEANNKPSQNEIMEDDKFYLKGGF